METILVVDDDVDLLLVLQHALNANGYNAATLADGSKVMETIEAIKPGIIVLDINMGEWNGCAICAAIKNMAAWQHIPVVLYSGVAADKSIISNSKADLFLQKPLSTNYFLQQIATLQQEKSSFYRQ